MKCTAPSRKLKERCPSVTTTLPVVKVESEGLPPFYVYRSEKGDYLVGDDVCTCKSFLIKIRELKPCKHICSRKFAPKDRTITVDLDDYTDILLSLVYEDRSLVLSLLIAKHRGEMSGEKEKKEEDY